MGYGGYSTTKRATKATLSYTGKSDREIFAKTFESAMNPKDVEIRESRDSEEHPNSLAIMLELDTTGSMGSIPSYLVRNGLPIIMATLIKNGIPDPQILFSGVGDHTCDRAPFQIGQFESNDDLLDFWLEKLWLEAGGGANYGESYALGWFFAAMRTSIDCWDKRKQKGFFFSFGDEKVHKNYSGRDLQRIFGKGEYRDWKREELLKMAQERYNVYHFHLKQGSNGTNPDVMESWRKLLGKNLIIVENREDILQKIVEIITNNKDVKLDDEYKRLLKI